VLLVFSCFWPMILIWLCKIVEVFYSSCCEKHFCINCLYFGQDLLDWHDKLLYWDYEIVIQIVSKWKIEPVMNGEILVYWVMSYELCNHTIVRPFKDNEFLRNEYYDGIDELKWFLKQLSSCVYYIVHR